MNTNECKQIFGIDDLRDLPNRVESILFGDIEERNKVYKELLALNKDQMGIDWFQSLYEEELSERKQKKQDFTPTSAGIIASLITGTPKGMTHEPTAGNGSMIIADWWQRCRSVLPWQFFPSEHQYTAWELSARSIPILLLNLSIRGIMGYVYHGDVLEQKIIRKYILLNRHDDFLAFSDIIVDENDSLKIVRV